MVCKVCGKKCKSEICFACDSLGNPRFTKKDQQPKQYRVFLGHIGTLLRLCHPDKHNNSEASTRVTKWLLEVRDENRSEKDSRKNILEGDESVRWKKRSQ
jgi:hypothetical protein